MFFQANNFRFWFKKICSIATKYREITIIKKNLKIF